MRGGKKKKKGKTVRTTVQIMILEQTGSSVDKPKTVCGWLSAITAHAQFRSATSGVVFRPPRLVLKIPSRRDAGGVCTVWVAVELSVFPSKATSQSENQTQASLQLGLWLGTFFTLMQWTIQSGDHGLQDYAHSSANYLKVSLPNFCFTF